MWYRESIKIYAKNFLRKHYWKAFLVCLIITILTVDNSEVGLQMRVSNEYYRNQVITGSSDKIAFELRNPIFNLLIYRFEKPPLFYIAKSAMPIIIIFSIILIIIVGYALEVGKNRFFLRGFADDVNISNLFSTFNSEEYFGIVKTQFLKELYIFLWSLLLIIPGIIKTYEYSMVPYILAQEPNLPTKEALRRSKEMTYGHKMNIFVLHLSFIGWYILGAFFLGLGGIFVNPYKEATFARLYNILSGNDGIDGTRALD